MATIRSPQISNLRHGLARWFFLATILGVTLVTQATPPANSARDSTATPNSIPAGSNTTDSSLLPIPPAAVEAKSLCQGHLKPFSSSHETLCENALVSDLCLSRESLPIYALHIEPASRFTAQARTIISLSLIHGDEEPSLELNLRWLERLSRAQDVRNRWIFIPVANPDGYQRKTRTNSWGVDLNRNFPTKDWDELALKQWEQAGKIPRRYPGTQAGSEPETQCLIRLIDEVKPHLIVSIHTPLRLLDFDGPNSVSPISILLPWRRLGHYPGSMGRYYWHERNIPVLTVELGPKLEASKTQLEQLQDQIGQLAYRLSAKPR